MSSCRPLPLIVKHHARIFSMHLKDTKYTDGIRTVYTPWGEGDTPVREILQVLKKNRWAIPVGIEFEHAVPPGSTWDAEIEKCIQYGKAALLGWSDGVRYGIAENLAVRMLSFRRLELHDRRT